MGALAHLETRSVPIVPGSQATVAIRVRNTGSVVDQFSVQVLGDAAAWAVVDPPTLSLFPGAEETARVTFSPPRSPQVPAGQLPFGLHVISKEDPGGSVVEEGVLDLAPFSDVFAELAPRTSRGSRSATHDLAIDNRGNAPLNATISAADPDRLLNFDVRPPGVVADPGTAAFAKVAVKPRKSFWRGGSQTRPFLIQVEPADAPAISIDGTMVQEAILPPWFMRALLAALGVLVLAVLLWVFFVRPAIQSTALEVAADVLGQVGITPPPDGFQAPGGGASGGGGGGQPTPSPASSPSAGGTADPSTTAAPPTFAASPGTLPNGLASVGQRLQADSPGLVVPAGQQVFITDLVFANPSSTYVGPIRLKRSDEDLLVLLLENFRDLDFHFVTPIVINSGQEIRVTCDQGCAGAAVYISGYRR